jgi:teichuronic acid exporter
MSRLKKIATKVSHSLVWAFLESVISAGASFLTILLVARYLSPHDFGEAGLAIAACVIIQSLMLGGMSDALNRVRYLHGTLIDSFFWVVVLIGIAATALCGLAAFCVGKITGNWSLASLMSVQGLTCLLFAVAAVPTGLLLRKMRTRKLAERTLVGKVVGLVVSVSFAIAGFGAWSLIIGNVASQFAGAVQLIAGMPRLPQLRFGKDGLRSMINIGLLAGTQQSLNTLTTRGFILAFGAVYGMHAVGLFNFALRLVEESGNLINNTLRRVAVSAFATASRSGLDTRPIFLTGTKVVTYVSAPVFAGAAAVMPDALPVIFGPKWLAAVPAVQILLVMWLIRSTRMLAPALVLAQGAAGVLVWSALAGLLATGIAFVISLPLGEFWSIMAYAAMLFGAMPVGLIFIKRVSNISVPQQLGVTIKPLFGTAIMAAVMVAFIKLTSAELTPVIRLMMSIPIGIVTFVVITLICDRNIYHDMKRILKR